jgi:glycosyltransferase involved in cell wall biosynthesis
MDEENKNIIRRQVRKELHISGEALLVIYGGNLGISQGLGFLMKIIETYSASDHIQFLIVGEGTWYQKIERFIREGNHQHAHLHRRVAPDEFRRMMHASDIGLIFLHPGFTIPNFPSRLTSYLEIGLPVIACTDAASDVGDVVAEAGCGFKIISGDLVQFDAVVQIFSGDPKARRSLAMNARKLFEERYTTSSSYAEINNSITNKHL